MYFFSVIFADSVGSAGCTTQCKEIGEAWRPSLPATASTSKSSPMSIWTHSSHSSRVSSQQGSRSHVVWRPGSSRIWMVKYRRKGFGADTGDTKNSWSPDSICWKPICKWSTQPMSLSVDESSTLRPIQLEERKLQSRRARSQPCLLQHTFGKRSHDDSDGQRPHLNFAKMKKVCANTPFLVPRIDSYFEVAVLYHPLPSRWWLGKSVDEFQFSTGDCIFFLSIYFSVQSCSSSELEVFDDDCLTFAAASEPTDEPMLSSSPPAEAHPWDGDLDVDAIENDTGE